MGLLRKLMATVGDEETRWKLWWSSKRWNLKICTFCGFSKTTNLTSKCTRSCPTNCTTFHECKCNIVSGLWAKSMHQSSLFCISTGRNSSVVVRWQILRNISRTLSVSTSGCSPSPIQMFIALQRWRISFDLVPGSALCGLRLNYCVSPWFGTSWHSEF